MASQGKIRASQSGALSSVNVKLNLKNWLKTRISRGLRNVKSIFLLVDIFC